MRKKLLLILILICVICLHAVVNRVQEKEKFQGLTIMHIERFCYFVIRLSSSRSIKMSLLKKCWERIPL